MMHPINEASSDANVNKFENQLFFKKIEDGYYIEQLMCDVHYFLYKFSKKR